MKTEPFKFLQETDDHPAFRSVSSSFRPAEADVPLQALSEGFVATGPAMKEVRARVELLSKIDVPVLLLGESGTGKEVTARLLHQLSPRLQFPFLKVNCAALPADLLESELFGCEKGAFTGATHARRGKFELCNHGTILLDEIGEMPLGLQAKLLHVLQDQQFFRLGGESTVKVNVRMLAATNVNIAKALAQQALREDLYYRLSAFMIHLPPLRDRCEDIPILLQYFIKKLAKHYHCPTLTISPAILHACTQYHWPGNLRELENFVRRYLILGDEKIAMDGFSAGSCASTVRCQEVNEGTSTLKPKLNGGLKSALRTVRNQTEISLIIAALEQSDWNRKRAARLLNISYRALLYKLRAHDLKTQFRVMTTSTSNQDRD
jgi:two-component system response regulator AtoC